MQDVCLFAHFDKDGKVDDYVLWYLARIKELNFSIVFISASRLTAADIERVRGLCVDLILRENAGLDFGSWAAGFARHGADVGGRLLLANDSVYGPIGSLQRALERLTAAPTDFYGFVESAEAAPHLQSWFLLFEPWVVQDPIFRGILAQPFSAMPKRQIINKGEIALSRRLVEAGFRYQALYPLNRQSRVTRRHAINPMHVLWRELLFEEGVPFLKIELLRDDPIGVADRAAILQTVEPIEPALCSAIRSHLARTAAPDAPRRPRRPLFARYRYALIGKSHRLQRENRRAQAAWTTVRLELLTVPLRMWRALNRLSCLLRPGQTTDL